ncbi:transcriptional adapter 2 [Phakopsora pachyrhizi]|uniref:Transcriptional adapter 2 n=1 Tax=Phakopsora pachyrhizi TaxID=170000 RepID=A0AAV0AFY3_PHAPC|nr:transcriptional adapter 2 [Phakopsora pachyrhizi]
MTVTKRKATSKKSENSPGIKYNCDGCSADISHTVRIRCAQQHTISTVIAGQPQLQAALVCESLDLCGSCFCEGKEVGRHKAWHDYCVVTQHSTPIFTEDWGADEELLLIDACQTYGLGNWCDIADHVGNGRSKEEVERHYLDVFVFSDDYPLPPMDVRIDIDQDEFLSHPPPPPPLASGPTNHEIAGFMPGRLDFETEWENEAENSIKDLSFGRVYRFGGNSQPAKALEEGDHNLDVESSEQNPDVEPKQIGDGTEELEQPLKKRRGLGSGAGKVTQRKDEQQNALSDNNPPDPIDETIFEPSEIESPDVTRAGSTDPPQNNNLTSFQTKSKAKEKEKEEKKESNSEENESEEVVTPIHDESDDHLELKLTIMEIYNERYDKRLEAKSVVFDRNLVEYKKIQAMERKLPKEIRDLVVRIKPFARLQTALDHERFQEGLIYEMKLRERISELQEYRSMGITTLAEAERYEKEKSARLAAKLKEYAAMERLGGRKQRTSGAFHEDFSVASREGTPGSNAKVYKRLPSLPLSLSTSASQQLLDASELALCSRLRILPKPFLFIKETIFKEFVRRNSLNEPFTRSDASKLLNLSDLVNLEDTDSRGCVERLILQGKTVCQKMSSGL